MLLTHSSLLVLLSVPLTLAAPAKGRPRTRNPLAKRTLYYTDGGQVSNKNYDYVIAGGGLTGVVLAKRLSEDASKTILLIEAGYDEENNPEVYGGSSMPSASGRSGGCANVDHADASQYQAAFDVSVDPDRDPGRRREGNSTCTAADVTPVRPRSTGRTRPSPSPTPMVSRRLSARGKPSEVAPPSTAWHGASPTRSR
jgi:choline dehydrogenase-like flavoprotein